MTTTLAPPVAVPTGAPAALQRALHGVLDNRSVDRLEAEVRALGTLQHVELHAAGLTDLDPVAATRLLLLLERLERAHDCAVWLVGLPAGLRRRLRFHPLLAFLPTEDALFRDPFEAPAPSAR